MNLQADWLPQVRQTELVELRGSKPKEVGSQRWGCESICRVDYDMTPKMWTPHEGKHEGDLARKGASLLA
jgi:hypothetical protein